MPGEVVQGGGRHSGPVLDQGHRDQEGRKQIRRQQLDEAQYQIDPDEEGGGGGDFPRNIMCAPLSGVEKGEYFDVMPYALTMGDYMLGFIKGPKFPRKLKCAFTNTASNATHATIRDLGFAANEDGTFDVYICGGMGNNPKIGVKAAEHIDPLNIRYYAKAMVETFKANGNYENRGRARTRYMQETLGVEGLKAEFNKQLEEAYKDSSLKIDKAEITAWENAFADELKAKQDKGEKASDELISNKRVYAQKQDGLYAVYYQPIGGMIEPKALVKLYETIKDMDAAVSYTHLDVYKRQPQERLKAWQQS